MAVIRSIVLAILACVGAVHGQLSERSSGRLADSAKALENAGPSFNLSCTWSHEKGCYLDYFDHLPDTDIRQFYKQDEDCRKEMNQLSCESNGKCEWTELITSPSSSGCYASVAQKKVNSCGRKKIAAVKSGSLCSVWKAMDRCRGIQQTRSDCEAFNNTRRRVTCTWKDNVCVLSHTSLVYLEFPENDVDARYVIEMQEKCDQASTRKTCEAYLRRQSL